MSDILEYSPPVALAIALNLLGLALKKSPVANWLIPLLLPFIGMGVYPFISLPMHYQVPNPTVLMAVYGFCIGAGSVGLNQAIKQVIGAKKNGDTTFFEKKDTK